MRIKFTFENEKNFISLPVHYHHIIQSMLYKNLPRYISDFLHNIGFFYKNRSFKLFTFSKIFSNQFHIKRKTIYFQTPITLYVSSGIQEITEVWSDYMLKKDVVYLGKNPVSIQSMEIQKKPKFENPLQIRTLSPITVYSTIQEPKKFTLYYFPEDSHFHYLLKENIKKKYKIITGEFPEDFTLSLLPLRPYQKKIIKYRSIIVKGIEGEFQLLIPPSIAKVIYDVGLGAKNSQGFGMFEVIES